MPSSGTSRRDGRRDGLQPLALERRSRGEMADAGNDDAGRLLARAG